MQRGLANGPFFAYKQEEVTTDIRKARQNMADKKKSEQLGGILTFIVLIAVCVWVGAIVSSKGENRLSQACKPVEFSTQLLHQLAFAVVGSAPQWTLYTQGYLMTGCYYAFSVIFSDKGNHDDLSKGNISGTSI
jgi:hypothetical protein